MAATVDEVLVKVEDAVFSVLYDAERWQTEGEFWKWIEDNVPALWQRIQRGDTVSVRMTYQHPV